MKKTLILSKEDFKYGLTNYSAAVLDASVQRYNTAQLLDNLNIPLSPLVDVKTSIYEDENTKTPVNVLYKMDQSSGMADPSVVTSLSTNADNTIHINTVSLEELYYKMFDISTLEDSSGYKVIYVDAKDDISTFSINNASIKQGDFTYSFTNPAVYKPTSITPTSQFICVAINKNNLLNTQYINADGTLSKDSSYFIQVQGFSQNDSPQYLELDTNVYHFLDSSNWCVFVSDSPFGAGLDYNLIVKPGIYFFTNKA